MSARLNRGGGDPAPSDQGQGIRGHMSLCGVPESDHLMVPSVDPSLIPYLNRMFPDRLALVEKLGSVEAARGARAVVEHLIELSKEQQDSDHVLRKVLVSAPGADGTSTPAAPAGGSPG